MRQSAPALPETPAAFSIDLLETLDRTWRTVCDAYDVVADLPDLQTLLDGADLTRPDEAAETVLANMLLEAMYGVSRFSPWYKRPLGLRLIRGDPAGRPRWAMTPGTREQWETLLTPLSRAIRSNVSLILAADWLDDLTEDAPPEDRVMATCLCVPSRVIAVKRTVFLSADIVCDTCRQPFRPIDKAR
jgi:hypothetical protein